LENDLKIYLENGQRLDDYKQYSGIISPMIEDKSPSFYYEADEGNWEKMHLASLGQTQRTEIYELGHDIVYAQPKPIIEKKPKLTEQLIKIKIEKEIDKAQFNTLSKLIDLGDFKRIKPRVPKNLIERIFEPLQVERKPFVLKKWTSPFSDFKNKKDKRRNHTASVGQNH
jgi:hypothetical protein